MRNACYVKLPLQTEYISNFRKCQRDSRYQLKWVLNIWYMYTIVEYVVYAFNIMCSMCLMVYLFIVANILYNLRTCTHRAQRSTLEDRAGASFGSFDTEEIRAKRTNGIREYNNIMCERCVSFVALNALTT